MSQCPSAPTRSDMKRHLPALILGATFAASAFAGSTGNSELHTPQGNGAASANGDYVSGPLNDSYRYFVEVPPGLTQLTIDIFDADIGLGGAGEATAGRDRNRVGYDTEASYTLWNPAGSQRTTQFTTGDTANPAGADNAWLTFFSSSGDFVRDNFSVAAYNNNDGIVNWAAAWFETNDNANPATGNIQITGGALRIRDNGDANQSTITREASLSGWSDATLTFALRTQNVEAGDQIRVQVSGNGGATWTTLETFTGSYAATTRSYDISAQIATNTRIRFITVGTGYSGTDSFFVDNVQIKDSTVAPGHWEVRIDQSSSVTGGDDINAFGLRAHDGTSGAGGTEINVYADSAIEIGQNPPASGTLTRSYTLFPYVTSGCSCGHNDFDYDSNRGAVGSATYESRTAAFSQSLAAATLSGDNAWNRDGISGWTTDSSSADYGIWQLTAAVSSYVVGGTPNGNYATYWASSFAAAANPPTANPQSNALRIYLPTDAGAAPAKPYLEQRLAQRFVGTLAVGVPRTYSVTVRVVNPTAHAITFSAANLVTANVPGSGAVYGGNAVVSNGSIASQPAVGGTGNVTWNPGTIAAGATAILSYDVTVTATSAGQRIVVTAPPASGNGTRAQFIDETGNTTQARATMLLGPICELAATQGLATPVVIASFDAAIRGGVTLVEWTTASEVGTAGFRLLRNSPTGTAVQASRSFIPATAPQGGTYRVVDVGNSDTGASYLIEELTADGSVERYGPFLINGISRDGASPDGDFDAHPREGGSQHPSPPRSGKKAKPVAVIAGVRELGMVEVTASQLAGLLSGNPVAIEQAVKNGKVSVTTRGAAVAWAPSSDGRAIRFFGEPGDSIYSSERAYRIELNRGETMPVVDVAPSPPAPTTYSATKHAEVDAFAVTVLPLDPDSDYWFWDRVVPGVAGFTRRSFAIEAPDLASDAGATLEVRLQGGLANVEHRVRIFVNGAPVGSATWQSFDPVATTIELPAGVLRSGPNNVEIEGLLGSGMSFDLVFVDGFTLSYSRHAVPERGALAMPVTPGSAVTVRSASGSLVALDVTNPRLPRLLRGGLATSDGVSLIAPAGAHNLFFYSESSTAPPSSLRAAEASSLSSANRAADYVIVAPEQLLDAAEGLARLRRRDGLETLVVDLDQIYDEFSAGERLPHAIHDFVATAAARWRRAPRYVVLAGAGTLDYRGIASDPGLVPPLLAGTRDGLFAADGLFTDLDGDSRPDIAIGRIPVWSGAELDAYVAKLEARNAAGPRAFVFAADARDRGADFRRYSEQIEAALGPGDAVRVYTDAVGVANARTALLAAWRNGSSLVNWIGHGGLDRISRSSLLTNEDVPTLSNADGALPVFIAMTCNVNRFELGGFESLGSALTRAPASGAVAVWSASGLSTTAEAVEIEKTLFRLARQSPGSRIGDLATAAVKSAAPESETARLYLLLGDPAITVDLPADPTPVETAPGSGE